MEILEYYDMLMINIKGNLDMLKKMFTMVNSKEDVKSFIEEYGDDWEKLYSVPKGKIE